MQQTCNNCNRTFEIDERERSLYYSAKNRAASIKMKNLEYFNKYDFDSLQAQWDNNSKADLIEDSVPNPFICPYCGHNTEYQRSGNSNSTSGCSVILCGILILFIGCCFLFTAYGNNGAAGFGIIMISIGTLVFTFGFLGL